MDAKQYWAILLVLIGQLRIVWHLVELQSLALALQIVQISFKNNNETSHDNSP